MLDNLSILAIIPARGGSKRVKNKNKRLIAGLPLISWTIRACLGCDHIDEIVVSTDDQDIAKIAKGEGITQIHNRLPRLASDSSPTMDTVLEIVDQFDRNGEAFDIIFLAQPTSPLRTSEDISSALEILMTNWPYAVIGVTETAHPKEWQSILADDGDMTSFLKNTQLEKSSGSLPKSYVVNGAIYMAPRARVLEEKTFFLPQACRAFVMSPRQSVDIDTEFDFEIAEYLLCN